MTTGPFSFTADADRPPIVPLLARIDAADVASVELHVRRHDRRGRTTIRTIRGLDLDTPETTSDSHRPPAGLAASERADAGPHRAAPRAARQTRRAPDARGDRDQARRVARRRRTLNRGRRSRR